MQIALQIINGKGSGKIIRVPAVIINRVTILQIMPASSKLTRPDSSSLMAVTVRISGTGGIIHLQVLVIIAMLEVAIVPISETVMHRKILVLKKSHQKKIYKIKLRQP